MLLNEQSLVCEVSSASNIREAQIVATPQMFKILYSQLYKNKEEAVIRELLSNAWDAHVVAGTTDTPIYIQLPNTYTPELVIKDFGTGLSPEDVESLYMDYGRSNKTDTNSLIGGFGLGSKSPFAYSDQFTVKSRWHGTEYTFQAFLQKSGAPACTQLASAPTHEPNGITIVVPQDASRSADDFTNAVNKIVPHIPTPPTGVSVEPLPKATLDWTPAEGEPVRNKILRARLTGTRAGQYRGSVTILQGIVPYVISTSSLDLPDNQRKLVSDHDLFLSVPIGTYEVTASREELALTPAVKTMLAEQVAHAHSVLNAAFVLECEQTPNWFTWAQLVQSSVFEDIPAPCDMPGRHLLIGFANQMVSGEDEINYDKDGILRPDAKIVIGQLTDTNTATRFHREPRLANRMDNGSITMYLSVNDLIPYGNNHSGYSGHRREPAFMVQAQPGTPYRKYLRGVFTGKIEGMEDYTDVTVLTGDIEKIRADFALLGVTAPVHPLVYDHKAARAKSKGRYKKTTFNNTKYVVRHIANRGGEWELLYERYTANQIIEKTEPYTHVLNPDTMGAEQVDQLADLLKAGLLTARSDLEFLAPVGISDKHTRVREAIRLNAGADYHTEFKTLPVAVDPQVLQDAIDKPWVQAQFELPEHKELIIPSAYEALAEWTALFTTNSSNAKDRQFHSFARDLYELYATTRNTAVLYTLRELSGETKGRLFGPPSKPIARGTKALFKKLHANLNQSSEVRRSLLTQAIHYATHGVRAYGYQNRHRTETFIESLTRYLNTRK